VSEPKVADRLPRGPHGLTRREVAESQRSRMITAMIDAVAEKGYVKTTVGDVLHRAGVSRATFYEQFDDKADCFRATYASVTGILGQLMDAASASLSADASASDPIERIDTIVGWYLDLLAESPSLAKVFLVEVYASGPLVIEQRRATIDSFVESIVSLLGDVPFPGTVDELSFTIRALVTALVGLATEAVATGETGRLRDLRAPYRALVQRVFGASDVRELTDG
jgi:AcrR family transcriptional regulator